MFPAPKRLLQTDVTQFWMCGNMRRQLVESKADRLLARDKGSWPSCTPGARIFFTTHIYIVSFPAAASLWIIPDGLPVGSASSFQ
jgi:hypothetical protein